MSFLLAFQRVPGHKFELYFVPILPIKPLKNAQDFISNLDLSGQSHVSEIKWFRTVSMMSLVFMQKESSLTIMY